MTLPCRTPSPRPAFAHRSHGISPSGGFASAGLAAGIAKYWRAVCLASVGTVAPFAQAQATSIETVYVLGEREASFDEDSILADQPRRGHTDAARLLALLPGASLNDNGALSGQIQYRGMTGPRMDVRVDGMRIPAGGPNWMDPPMHYAPIALLESVTLKRGIASVTSGGIGGHAQARWKRPAYGTDGWHPSLDFDASARSVDEGTSAGLIVGAANQRQRFFLAGSTESAQDYAAAAATVIGTEFERHAHGGGYGFAAGAHAFDASYYRIDTDAAGTPSLPMDIEFFDSQLWRGEYGFRKGDYALSLSVGGSAIGHAMNNHGLRPAPDFSALPLPPFAGTDRRRAAAESDGFEARVRFSLPLAGSIVTSGFDWLREDHDAVVRDPDFAPFFAHNFADVRQKHAALYGQWAGAIGRAATLEAGVRLGRVQSSAGQVDAFPARLVDANPAAWPLGTPPRAVWALRQRFNVANRNAQHDLADWLIRLQRDQGAGWTYELAVARKSRTPLYQELFLWIPLEVNAGLGDGNNYVGDARLKAEVSHQAEAGIQWAGARGHFSARVHYRRVADYIQGVASTDGLVNAVSGRANGDPTPMRFANVDAELYGVDLTFNIELAASLFLDGNAAYVRGKRRDVADNLYRIAPPNMRLGLSWRRQPLRVTVEQALVAKQNNLSAELTDDPASPATASRQPPATASPISTPATSHPTPCAWISAWRISSTSAI